MTQLTLSFPAATPTLTDADIKPLSREYKTTTARTVSAAAGCNDFKNKYRKEWNKAFAALGGCDKGGWVQDLCLYYDLQWNVKTGEVGPTRWFIAPLILDGVFDCREIPMPENLNIHQAFELVVSTTKFHLIGSGAVKWQNMIYRTADASIAKLKRDKKAKRRFCYEDRTARTGKIHLAKGASIQPARVVWKDEA